MAVLSPGAAHGTALAHDTAAAAQDPTQAAARISLRRIPYPYRAMLALSSDLDETPDRDAYLESMRYLNTTETTSAGAGVGLEVGNSIYFDMAPDQFAYWNTDDAGRAAIRALIQTGHVDVLHSFGDLATTRAHAGRALDELSRHGCRIAVWVDHAVAPTNFGADIMAGLGDAPGSAAYHADLTCAYGIRFVWRGRVTSVLGQDVPRQLRGIFDAGHPLASMHTLRKEFLKGALARAGSGKYAMHAPNATLRRARLRDGHEVWEFLRCNPHWGGVSSAETAAGLGDVLTPAMLDRLIAREGVAIVYTHLGKVAGADRPFPARSRAALRDLAARRNTGAILVTTTRRVLGYRAAFESAHLTSHPDGRGLQVDLSIPEGTADKADWQGLSIYVPDSAVAHLRINGRDVADVRRNPADHTGRASISVPWVPLEWPRL